MVKRKIPAPALFAAALVAAAHMAAPAGLAGEPLVSPTWGFRIDPPEDYDYVSGDGRDKFSFQTPEGAYFELAVYPPAAHPAARTGYPGLEALAADAAARLNNRGETSVFDYRNRKAVLMELDFPVPATAQGGSGPRSTGWALCMELEDRGAGTPLILALAFGPADRKELGILHLSALDSLAVREGDSRYPGPITEFAYPRGERIRVSPAGTELEASIRRNDPQAAQALVDREFEALRRQADSPRWQQAWARFYRAIHRDSYSRLSEVAPALLRRWSQSAAAGEAADLAGQALGWVQSFAYERNFMGSDFVNPVSAALEGRGDCDSRAMLWAIILEQADIPAAIMVSAHYGHAMGLADLEGAGARFDWAGRQWLVAETTATTPLGRIGQKVSDSAYWLGIVFQ
jgi:hypothetical protein